MTATEYKNLSNLKEAFKELVKVLAKVVTNYMDCFRSLATSLSPKIPELAEGTENSNNQSVRRGMTKKQFIKLRNKRKMAKKSKRCNRG